MLRGRVGGYVVVSGLVGPACFTDTQPDGSSAAMATDSGDDADDGGSTGLVEPSSTGGADETTMGLGSTGPTAGSDGLPTSTGGTEDGTGTDGGEPVDPLAPWGEPVLVEGLNSDARDDDPTLSPDMLEIYFASTRDGVEEIFIATRLDVDSPWSEASPVTGLGPVPANGRGNPAVSPTGTTLFYTETVAGDIDLYVATRANQQLPFSNPVAVSDINTTDDDFAAAPSEDLLSLVFARNTGSNADLYLTTRPAVAAAWSEPVLIEGVNSRAEDSTPWIDPAFTVLMFASNRPGGMPLDLYISVRPDTESPWSTPIPVDSLNTDGDDQDPWFSADGRTLFFATGPAGGTLDIYTATR